MFKGGNKTPFSLLECLCTGTASAQMYYLLVYGQLVIITPLLYKLLRRHRALLYAITPITLFINVCCSAAGVALPYIQSVFPSWLLFYHVGLDWPYLCERTHMTTIRHLAAPSLFLIGIQIVIGAYWAHAGHPDLSTTQLKLSSMLCSLCVVSAIGTFVKQPSGGPLANLLSFIGDRSFGVYLCHTGILAVLRPFFEILNLPNILLTPLFTLVVLFTSTTLVTLCKKTLPHPVLRAIGFS